jgi:hypothetical protein
MKSKKHIPIDDNIHFILKNYCKENGVVLKAFVEKLIIQKLKSNGVYIQTCETRQK